MNFIIPLFSLSYDEHCQFPKFAISGPITRTQYVLSKYVPALVLAVAGGIVSFLMQFYLSKTSFQWALFSAVLTIGTPLILVSILFPLIFKLGVERARVAMFVCYVLVFTTISGQRTGLKQFLKMAETFSLVFSTLLSVVVIILVYLVSITVSKQILFHKEY
ncbi:MAG: ABC-2 transporter permease [Limnochordia bacterium]|nr:ABC-2 transporter permease [Limnochordia bacterium]